MTVRRLFGDFRFPSYVGYIVLTACLFVISLSNGAAINNSDWRRVSDVSGFHPEYWTPIKPYYPFTGKTRITRSSTMGVLVGLLAALQRDLLSPVFITATSILSLSLLFLLGIFLLAKQGDQKHKYLIILLLLLMFSCYGFYIKSFYEEAAILAFLPWLCFGYYKVANKRKYFVFTISSAAIIYSKQQMIFAAPMFMLLLFFGAAGERKNLRFASSLFMLLLVSAFTISLHPDNEEPNQYNRYFNGIGWALLNSYNWPADDFNERHAYFYENQGVLQSGLPDLPYRNFLGTSFWPTGADLRKKSKSLTEEELLLISAFIISLYADNKEPNQNNRYFNRVGGTLFNSYGWPTDSFVERHEYLYQNQGTLQSSLPNLPYRNFLGTPFWPIGADLRKKSKSLTEEDRAYLREEYSKMIGLGSYTSYLHLFLKNPSIVLKLIKNTYLITVKSNYSILYLRLPIPINSRVIRIIQSVQPLVCRYLGFVFVGTILLLYIIGPSWPSFVAVSWMALTPLVTVAGDGFYEFEKHMVSYMMLIPFLVAVSVSKAAPSDKWLIGIPYVRAAS
jgi:hypothetical protein